MSTDKGSIHIHKMQLGDAYFWIWDHVVDRQALVACGCPPSFKPEEYEEILRKVSAQGYDLSTPLESA